MKNSLKFISLFLAEISKTYPSTIKAKPSSELSYLIDDEDIIKTCSNISLYRTK